MLIYQNKKLYKILIALIAIIIVIGNECFCVQRSLNDAVPFDDNNNLELLDETTTNLYSTTTTPPIYLNVSEHPGELCNRVCVSGQLRLCYFEFNLEFYQAMGVACGKCAQGVKEDCNHPQCIVGDGVEKGVMSINRQVPGPPIQVCKYDTIIVDVHNQAHGTAATIHWHGLHMVDTPHMDGMPFVTQCPIPFANSFRYQFYATEAGTQFYHSHTGHHKANGQYGALIVRQSEDPSAGLYDYDLPEHHILISDWMHTPAEQYYPGLPNSGGISPDSVLINGRGTFTNPKTKERTNMETAMFDVIPGKRYRFRFINSISHACPFQLQIEKHSLTIISSDSYDVQPRSFDTLVTNAGERYDFIVEANHTNGFFWIRVTGLGACASATIESYALIRYNTSEVVDSENELEIPPLPSYEEQYPVGMILNHPNAACFGGENDHCVTELTATEHDNELRYAKPDFKFYLSFRNYPVSNKDIFVAGQYMHFMNPNSNITLVGVINNNSLIFPASPLLNDPDSIDESQFCDSSDRPARCLGQTVCPCVHRLKVKLNSIVALVVVDETTTGGRTHHPFHLHGHRFMVTDLGQHPLRWPMNIPLAKQMEKANMLPKAQLNSSPPFKDTVSIPSSGYADIRFRATNPGFWIMHCHYEWHLAIGMGLILQVGEPSEMVKTPTDFPKCGNYLPPVQSLRSQMF